MAPSKRSSSPSHPPAWIREFQQSIRDQELAIRELRIVTMETQQVLQSMRNESVRSPMINVQSRRTASSITPQNSSIQRQPIVQITTPVPRVAINSVRPRAPVRPVQPSKAIIAHNEAIRQSAVRIPRVAHSASHLNRICWFHRQFGRASVNCLPPCTFVDQVPNLEKVKNSHVASLSIQDATSASPVATSSPILVQLSNPSTVHQSSCQPTGQDPVAMSQNAVLPNQAVNASTPQVDAIQVRFPLERRNGGKRNLTDSQSSSESSEKQSPKKNCKANNPDWNELAKPESSSSSSSSSSSEEENAN